MNGLTAANVDGLVDAIKKTHANCLALERREAARALADVLFVIHQLREENTIQTSRPDRVGDECWFRTSGDWQRGILRVWDVGCECSMAIVEDKKTGVAKSTTDISFSIEAPK
jgi:hypothetical protein